ncbi:MAG: hypothetical protein HFJ43_02755 [Clostridia bacterium]|nr:hypothetical protein [Clostridia bacterium]
MKLIIMILTICIFFQTIGFGVFEYKENKNKIAGVTIFTLATIGLILPNVAIFILY